MAVRPLPPNCIAFSGGMPLFSGGDEENADAATRDVEVLLTGDFKTRNFSVQQKQMEEMILNHVAANVDPVIDREHESWLGTSATEARGWVKALRIEPAKNHPNRTALVATVELTDLGVHALKNKHFRYLSAGINLKGKNRLTGESIGAVLDHVALVKNPYVQGMEPLSLSAHIDDSVEEKTMSKLFAAAVEMLSLSADASEESVIEALSKRVEADKGLIEALKAKAEAGQVALSESEKLASRVKALETEKLTAEVDAAVSAFKLDPAERGEWLKLAEKDEAMFRSLIALRPVRNPGGPEIVVKSGAKLDKAALQEKAITDYLKANSGADYSSALVACAALDPVLFAEVA